MEEALDASECFSFCSSTFWNFSLPVLLSFMSFCFLIYSLAVRSKRTPSHSRCLPVGKVYPHCLSALSSLVSPNRMQLQQQEDEKQDADLYVSLNWCAFLLGGGYFDVSADLDRKKMLEWWNVVTTEMCLHVASVIEVSVCLIKKTPSKHRTWLQKNMNTLI